MAIIVKNINGTSVNKCNCDSWLDHWKNFSLNAIGNCRVEGCLIPAEVGAHVQRENDQSWFIIPLCKKHNSHSGDLKVWDSTTFVSANVQKTCAKKYR